MTTRGLAVPTWMRKLKRQGKQGCWALLWWACVGVSAQTPAEFSGAAITMQFQKIDLRAALQILADFSGVNLVLADSVSGSLSLRLHFHLNFYQKFFRLGLDSLN